MRQFHMLEKMMINSEFFTLSGFEAHRNLLRALEEHTGSACL
jgi:hypothetical protein